MKKIIPERLYKNFITNVKFTYTRDNEKDIPVVEGSNYNIIITNTEKIRIQKQRITKSLAKEITMFNDEIKKEIANRRLQTIASLPNLAIFSDEAHHTYGQKLNKELKRIRQTVDYLANNTNVLVVINTTGTPYYKKEVLKDVVFWYGLSQGIEDGILKEVKNNIVSYEKVTDEEFVTDVINDFFINYKNVKLYDGSPAKLAIYFPKIEDLLKLKTTVEISLINVGLDPSVILEVHNESSNEIKDLFDNRINDPYLPYRVFLLVNKGTEGWNCPSLFATALARKLKSSNNFCLQAATRCMRQVPENEKKAKIYLSEKNAKTLESQLSETYGESITSLKLTTQNLVKKRIYLRKTEIPQLKINKRIKKVVPSNKQIDLNTIKFEKPSISNHESKKIISDFKEIPDKKGMLITRKEEKLATEPNFIDLYSFSVELSSLYRLPLIPIFEKIKNLYPNYEIPEKEANEIKKQLEKEIKSYDMEEEKIEQSLAIIKTQGFDKERKGEKLIYTAEIIFHKDKIEKLLSHYKNLKQKNPKDFGFHYDPYFFDSIPEKTFFTKLLIELNEKPSDVEDIYFTGGLTDPSKTDFFFEYLGTDEKWHTYTPDFLIRKSNGKTLIVEIKAERFRTDNIDGENGLKAAKMREIENINSNILKYKILFVNKDDIDNENLQKVFRFVNKNGGSNNE